MFFRMPKILVTMTIAIVVVPSTLKAECLRMTPKTLRDAPSSELVFAGTVIEVVQTGELGTKATFEVERVWRGKVTRRLDVYMWHLASAEAPLYAKGGSYVVVAQRLQDQRAREGVGLGGSDVIAFTGAPCSAGHTVEEFVRQLGRGELPIDKATERK